MQVTMSMKEYEQLKENEINFNVLKEYIQIQEEKKQKNKVIFDIDFLLLNAIKENDYTQLKEELEYIKNKQAY